MAHAVYILFSAKLDRYHVGESENPERRLEEHRSHVYKHSATSKAKDWELRVVIACADRAHARRLEHWVKTQKSRKVIERLLEEERYRAYQVQRFR